MRQELILFLVVVAGGAVYLLPSVLAAWRSHYAAGWLLALNVSCGWIWQCWLALILWAIAGKPRETVLVKCNLLTDPPGPEDGEPLLVPLYNRRPGIRRRLQAAGRYCVISERRVGAKSNSTRPKS